MSDQRLDEYRRYYDARTERYANNPHRYHSYEAEKRLRDLFYRYDTLEEIRDNLGTLNIDCAFAAWRDQYEMESQYYGSVDEPIRKKGADEVLSQLDLHTDITEMSSAITDITNRNSMEISTSDASGHALMEAWQQLDAITVLITAEVPEEYGRDMHERAEELRRHVRETVQSTEETMRAWVPAWRLKPETALEPRYRRLLPFSDEEVTKHLQQFKAIINR